MKTQMIQLISLGLMATQPVFADGFICETPRGDLAVKVFNQTDAEDGVRNAAIMVLSDPRVARGRKTIATFSSVDQLLENEGAHYTADVDLRFKESSRKGELVGPTKLGELETIELQVDFQYGDDLEDGDYVPATLLLTKRNGDHVRMHLNCSRYLKGLAQ